MSRSIYNNLRPAFTLVEMLVVVLIIGIAMTVIIPMIGNCNDFRVATAARQLVSALLYAQTKAISTQQRHRVVFDSAGNNYKIEVQNTDGSFSVITHPVNKSPYQITYSNIGELESVTIDDSVDFGGESTVWFDSLGVPYSGDAVAVSLAAQGDVTVSAGSESQTISVAPVTGRVSIN